MDDVKNQFKGLAKKFNNPFASSSSRFKGEGQKLGNAQESSKQPSKSQAQPSPQQASDWRKLQQERWEKERSSHPTPRQDRSHHSAASSALSQPSNVPTSDHSTAGTPVRSSDISSKRANGFSEIITSDALTALKLDDPGIINATNVQNCDGSDYKTDTLEAVKAQNLNRVHKHAVNSSKIEADNSESHVNHEGDSNLSEFAGVPSDNPKMGGLQYDSRFDPFSSQIGSMSSSANMSELQMYQCPVCGSWWKSEKEVNAHVDECLSQSTCTSSDLSHAGTEPGDEQIKVSLGVFLSGGPSSETMDVILRILRNIVNSPDLEKFRKIRLSNPKIHNTVGMALGGVEILEAVGFTYQTEEEEIWAVMDSPSIDQLQAMQGVISQLETHVRGFTKEEITSNEKAPVQRKVDRQVRVFYADPENSAAKMDLPDSFFQLSASEFKQEAVKRKKKLEDSQLLVSKVSRDRMAAANKRKYKAAIIRIQFPDGVVLQGMFLPWEPTTAIYEFVSNSLRDPSTRYTLVAPGMSRKQVIPAFAEGSGKIPTLEEANLVPAVLVKFECAEINALTFTGLHPDVLIAIEPLSSTTLRS